MHRRTSSGAGFRAIALAVTVGGFAFALMASGTALAKTVQSIEQPALFVEYTGDVSTFPSVARSLFAAIGTSQKAHLRVRGDHHGRALAKGEELGRNIAGAKVRDWLREHFA